MRYLFLILLLFLTASVDAKDLYVATTGSDSTSYEDNDIDSPWLTASHALTTLVAGDNLYFRSGTYSIASEITTNDDGTSESPITISNYGDEVVTLSGSCSGHSLISLETNYFYFDDLNFQCSNNTAGEGIFFVGMNTTATNFKITGSTLTTVNSQTTDNAAAIVLSQDRSADPIITNNTFIGSDSDHGVIVFRTDGVEISNNEFSGHMYSIYYKHSNDLSDSGVKFTNNYIHDSDQGIRTVANYANISNNLIVDCGTGIMSGDDAGTGDGGIGGDYSTIDHNTIIDCTYPLQFLYQSSQGITYNTVTNNIFSSGSTEIHRYGSTTNTNTTNYNIYVNNTIWENYSSYTLSTWQSHNSSDENSEYGSIAIVGGASPSTISDYALTSESVGYKAAADGSDLGANVALVGVDSPTSGSSSLTSGSGATNMTASGGGLNFSQ